MTMRPCSKDGCERPNRARGLCSTHYNQEHQPGRHVRDKACACCGAAYVTTRTDGRFCSLLCRDYVRWGPTSKPWPRARVRVAVVKPEPFREQRECAWCAAAFVARRVDHVMCTRRCKGKAKNARRRALEAGAPGTYTWAEVIGLYVRFGRCCAYCLHRTDTPEPDHVLALSRGGSNSITNILPACQRCNGDKRELTLDEWAADRKRRGLDPSVATWSADDRRYWHLTTARSHAA